MALSTLKVRVDGDAYGLMSTFQKAEARFDKFKKGMNTSVGSQSMLKDMTDIAIGGGAVIGITMLGNAVGKTVHGFKDLQLAIAKGEKSGLDMSRALITSLPVVGGFIDAFITAFDDSAIKAERLRQEMEGIAAVAKGDDFIRALGLRQGNAKFDLNQNAAQKDELRQAKISGEDPGLTAFRKIRHDEQNAKTDLFRKSNEAMSKLDQDAATAMKPLDDQLAALSKKAMAPGWHGGPQGLDEQDKANGEYLGEERRKLTEKLKQAQEEEVRLYWQKVAELEKDINEKKIGQTGTNLLNKAQAMWGNVKSAAENNSVVTQLGDVWGTLAGAPKRSAEQQIDDAMKKINIPKTDSATRDLENQMFAISRLKRKGFIDIDEQNKLTGTAKEEYTRRLQDEGFNTKEQMKERLARDKLKKGGVADPDSALAYNKAIRKLNEQVSTGAIDIETYGIAVKQANEDLKNAQSSAMGAAPDALAAGSAEAARLMVQMYRQKTATDNIPKDQLTATLSQTEVLKQVAENTKKGTAVTMAKF